MSRGTDDNAAVLPRLYDEFSPWWPLLSSPEDYAEEAAFYRKTLVSASSRQASTLLELGCGGGNNASHMKAHFQMTLSDVSAGMLAVSQTLNPECEHEQGDMRTIRLERTFDFVFAHDAIDYMTTLDDLRRAFTTAFVHLSPGGAALFAPDHTRENFRPSTDCGGHDGATRGLRYLEWTWDPDPDDTSYVADYAYLLRMEDGSVRAEHDRHQAGLFSRDDWLRLLTEVGFESSAVDFVHSEVDVPLEVFIGKKTSA